VVYFDNIHLIADWNSILHCSYSLLIYLPSYLGQEPVKWLFTIFRVQLPPAISWR